MSTEMIKANVEATLSEQDMFSTVRGNDMDSRKRVFSAITNPVSISEMLEKNKGSFNITVSDIIVQKVELTNEQTGELEVSPRVIFITPDGVAYSATSKGLLTSVKNILGILGDPNDWAEPVTFTLLEKRGKVYRYMTMEIA